jgi:hypothetical protein
MSAPEPSTILATVYNGKYYYCRVSGSASNYFLIMSQGSGSDDEGPYLVWNGTDAAVNNPLYNKFEVGYNIDGFVPAKSKVDPKGINRDALDRITGTLSMTISWKSPNGNVLSTSVPIKVQI